MLSPKLRRTLALLVATLLVSQANAQQVVLIEGKTSPSAVTNDAGAVSGASGGVVTSNTGSTGLNGTSLNDLIGASTFYANGYTGSRAVVTNVEAGHIWNGHETLTHVTQFFDGRATFTANGLPFNQLGQADRHATWVAQVIGGRIGNTSSMPEYARGIAYGAQLWSGAIATSWDGPAYSNSWSWSRGYAFADAYGLPMLTGVNGRRTDVVNSSWGFFNTSDVNITGGNALMTLSLDGMARASRATVVALAGNEGAASNTLRAPGNGYNSIVVGALENDLANPPYNSIAGFSSRGPQLYVGPDGSFGNVRARVDITAPGTNLTLAFYGGVTGGNTGGTDPTGGANNQYTPNSAGTSFAAPIVAGGATLLADVAYDRFASNALNARDGQVIKAVLLNSASKPTGWNNGQSNVAGVIKTTQALDYTYGAGILNLTQAFTQYTAGTTDVTGTSGGTIAAVGWDYGIVNQGGNNDYLINSSLTAGSSFIATLNWFVGRTFDGTNIIGGLSASDNYFTKLRLELWNAVGGVATTEVAESSAQFINTQHFALTIPSTGQYLLRVAWDGERYDFVGNSSQTYGLAWAGQLLAVPEPSSIAMMGFCLLGAGWIWCRRQEKKHAEQSATPAEQPETAENPV